MNIQPKQLLCDGTVMNSLARVAMRGCLFALSFASGQHAAAAPLPQEPQGEIIGTVEGQAIAVKGPMSVQVVGNEVKVNVINQPYGGFPWLWIPQYANTNWYNAHNFYGDLKDIEAAKLDEVQSFFKTYYAPNNAALAVVGDFEPDQAKAMVAKYFASIPASKLPPTPDLSEPKQEKEIVATRKDNLANRPALAFAYHMPQRNSPEYYAMGLLDQMLIQGDDSLLHQELVKKRGFAGSMANIAPAKRQFSSSWMTEMMTCAISFLSRAAKKLTCQLSGPFRYTPP